MGKIATKNLLREISNAKRCVELNAALGEATSPTLDAMADVRAIDAAEDEEAFKTALRVGEPQGRQRRFS